MHIYVAHVYTSRFLFLFLQTKFFSYIAFAVSLDVRINFPSKCLSNKSLRLHGCTLSLGALARLRSSTLMVIMLSPVDALSPSSAPIPRFSSPSLSSAFYSRFALSRTSIYALIFPASASSPASPRKTRCSNVLRRSLVGCSNTRKEIRWKERDRTAPRVPNKSKTS